MLTLLILATEGGIPPSNPWAKLAVPIGILVFVGSVYLLLRSNLGTRRGYLVMSTSLWGFGLLLALFWTFGAPGTPPATGPQNLPGQDLDYYLRKWIPYASTSTFAETYPNDPAEFGPVPDDVDEDLIAEGVGDIKTFFSGFAEDSVYSNLLTATDEAIETLYTKAADGRDVIAVTYAPTCSGPFGCVVGDDGTVSDVEEEGGEADVAFGGVIPGAPTTTLFAQYDRGNELLPSLLMTGIMAVLWVLHMVLLYRDERREADERAEERAEQVSEPAEPVPA